MNHLVVLKAQAGELEKILSGVKTMLVKEGDSGQGATEPLNPGDSLYFLREQEGAVRVKATVVRVLRCGGAPAGDLSLILKEMQPRLQLSEEQYNEWSARPQVVLVEFGAAHKIVAVHVAPEKLTAWPGWTAFGQLSEIICSGAGLVDAGARR